MNTKALRQKILDLAIHGKLVPQNPNDESATVLLEKIRAEKAEKIKKGELKADKKDSFIFVGSDKRHYEQFADGTVKDIEEEIPFEIPEGWAWCRLGEISSELGDGIHGTPEYDVNGDYYFVNGNNLCNGKIIIKDDTKRVSQIEYNKYKKNLNQNTILVSINGTLGNIAFYNKENIILGKSACYFNLFEKQFKDFMFFLLSSEYFKKYASENATGSTIKNVSLKTMRDFLVPLPTLNEQKKIVSAIKTIFNQITIIENDKTDLQEIIKQTKSKILDLAIHGKLVPQDPNDEPAEELLKRIATSDNRPYEKVEEKPFEIPDSWKWVKLGDIGQTNIGLTYHPKDISNTGITVLRFNNIQNDKLCFDDVVKVNPNTKILNNQYINNGDILICARNGSQSLVGKCVLLNNLKEKTSFGAFMAVFRSNYNRYILKYLQSKYFKDYMFESNSTQIHQLTQSMLKDALIPFPPEKEQVRIVAKIDELYSQLDQIQNNLV